MIAGLFVGAGCRKISISLIDRLRALRKRFRRGVRNVARLANRSPSVEARIVETVKTCAVLTPRPKDSLRPAATRFQGSLEPNASDLRSISISGTMPPDDNLPAVVEETSGSTLRS